MHRPYQMVVWNKQMAKQSQLGNTLQNVTLDAAWSQYIKDNDFKTIRDFGHWEALKSLHDDGKGFPVTIQTFHCLYRYTSEQNLFVL